MCYHLVKSVSQSGMALALAWNGMEGRRRTSSSSSTSSVFRHFLFRLTQIERKRKRFSRGKKISFGLKTAASTSSLTDFEPENRDDH